MEETQKHSITLQNRRCLSVCEVEDVESFDEEKVVILTSMGTLTVTGNGFRIQKLNVDAGELVIDGEVDELKYSHSRNTENQGGFLSRLFQ